jgi:hypothetical protein
LDDNMAKSNHLNLTIIALVALVAIVALVALVMNAASAPNWATGPQLVQAQDQNIVGYDVCTVINPAGCRANAVADDQWYY